MKLTYRDMINIISPLNKMMVMELPATIALKIVRLSQKLNPEIENYYKVKDKFISEHGVLNEKTNQYDVYPEKQQYVKEELNKLLDDEIELDIKKIKIPKDVIDNMYIKPVELICLEKVFDF